LFWGGMTGNALAGLVLALIVEATHWTRLRWDFDDSACIRAWHLCVVAMALATAFIWIEGNPYLTVPRLLGWLPALLLPLQFVQGFGLRNAIAARTFAFFTKRQRARNLRHGLAPTAAYFNFGHVYLVTVMVAATPLGARPESWLFLPGLVVLTIWELVGAARCRPAQVVPLLLVAGGIGLLGQVALAKAYNSLNFGSMRDYEEVLNPSHYRTAIGHLGEIKQSPGILWRLRPNADCPAPTHLRSAGYNRYRGGLWSNVAPPESRADDSDFKPLVPLLANDATPFHPLRGGAGPEADRPGLWRFTLRGAAAANAPVPLPGDAASLREFKVDAFERNSLGTVRVFPKEAVIAGEVAWHDPANAETPPWLELDLDVPANDQTALRQVLTKLRLAEQPNLAAKLAVLRRFFQGFQYTRYNTIKPPPIGTFNRPGAISLFLTKSRRGHCEYFATAACLLLREAGIPSRYAIGYAVMEHDAKRAEWVVRGLHGHAWCRVWDERGGTWLDFDPTPPDWLASETGHGLSLQWLLDGVQRLREDFALWRSRSYHRLILSAVMLGIGCAGLAWIAQRLWRSKRSLGPAGTRRKAATTGGGDRTPLHQLEKPASHHLPPRPPGQPFGQWLAGLDAHLTEKAALDEAIHLHQQLRFDPAPPPPCASARLAILTKQLAAALRTRRVDRG
jgi:hypothetical protein